MDGVNRGGLSGVHLNPIQEPLKSPGLCSYVKILKTPFFGNISNSCRWATHMDLKPPQKNFFKNISKTTSARGFQNFVTIEGAAVILSEQ